MKLTSTAFAAGGPIPPKYTCDGDNINPPLTISDVPKNAVSLVLIMDDPDVPTSVRKDNNWDHWIIWNIPPDTTEIRENDVPHGVVGKNTNGDNMYGGPCPPDKEHRYFFKLYALDTMLDLPDDVTTKADLAMAMNHHILDKTELMGTYRRQ